MAALKDNKKSTTTVIFDFFGVLIDENSQKPIAHTALFLEHCAAKELPIYLLTNALPHKLAMYADIHPALFAHFTAIITPQEAGYKKPDPRIFLYAINQFTLIPKPPYFLMTPKTILPAHAPLACTQYGIHNTYCSISY